MTTDGTSENPRTGLSRRDVMRGGVVVAGAAWVVPVISVLSMNSAAADTPSGGGTSSPSFSIDPTETTNRPDPPPTTPATATGTTSTEGASGSAGPDSGRASELAFTGVDVPVLTGAAVGLGAVVIGAASVMAARRPDTAGTPDAAGDAPRGPRRH